MLILILERGKLLIKDINKLPILENSLFSGLFKEFKSKFFTKSAFYSITFLFVTGILIKHGIYYFTQVDIVKNIFHPYSYIFGAWMAIEGYAVKILKTMDLSLFFSRLKFLTYIFDTFKSYSKITLGEPTDHISDNKPKGYLMRKVHQNPDGSWSGIGQGNTGQNNNGAWSNSNNSSNSNTNNSNSNSNNNNSNANSNKDPYKKTSKIVLIKDDNKNLPENILDKKKLSSDNNSKLNEGKINPFTNPKYLDHKVYKLPDRDVIVYSANMPDDDINMTDDDTTSNNTDTEDNHTELVLDEHQIYQIAYMQHQIDIINSQVENMFEEFEDVSDDITILEADINAEGPDAVTDDEYFELEDRLNDLDRRSNQLLYQMNRNMIRIRRLEADIRAINPNYESGIDMYFFEDYDVTNDGLDSPRSVPESRSSESGYDSND